MKTDKINILIVDDNEFYRKGLILTLNRIKMVVQISEADNGKIFLDLIKNNKYDIIFMDIKMPELDGISATKKAIQINNYLNIIALTMHMDNRYLMEMILAGAKGFMYKDSSNEEFNEAINAVLSGQIYYSQRAIDNMDLSQNRNTLTDLF